MGYQTGTASSMADLVTTLGTFMTGEGWTEDDLDTGNGEASYHKGNLFISFRWNTTTPLHLAVYQSQGYGVGLSKAVVAVGGTGYSVDDVLTINQGTAATHATVKVTEESGGVVTAVEVVTAGIDYTVTPGNPVSTTGGAGNCTLTCTFTGNTDRLPGNGCDDSGQGIISNTNANLADSRGFYNIGDGPYTSYHFFAPSSPTDTIHIVLEYTPGIYSHGGFGSFVKAGDWKGGEYCYGTTWTTGVAPNSVNTVGLDGLSIGSGNGRNMEFSVHAELDGLVASWPDADSKWLVGHHTDSATLDDRAGNPKGIVIGGLRGGLLPNAFGWLRSDKANGFVPMQGIQCFYWDPGETPDELIYLGVQSGTRMMNMAGFEPGEEFTTGGLTWIVFPWRRKQYTVTSPPTDESRNGGIAYRKQV